MPQLNVIIPMVDELLDVTGTARGVAWIWIVAGTVMTVNKSTISARKLDAKLSIVTLTPLNATLPAFVVAVNNKIELGNPGIIGVRLITEMSEYLPSRVIVIVSPFVPPEIMNGASVVLSTVSN